jgi:sec-independent protein translocase protein TatA
MPGLGHWYIWLILLAVALIIFGPSRLPELGASLGRSIKEFRKATSEMGDALEEEVHKPDESTPTAIGTTYPAAASTAPTSGAEPAAPPSVTPPAPVPPPEAPKA